MHLLLLNQFLPPDASPTARLLGELGDALVAAGHQVTYVGESGGYRDQKTILGSRALREIASLLRILINGSRVTGIEAVVCFTSPPLLPAIAYLLALRHRAPLAHWAMDIYPDVAVALGEVRPQSPIHRITAFLMRRAYRHARLVVALDGDMEQLLRKHGASHVRQCAPWPPAIVSQTSPDPPTAPTETTPFKWLYSGNLGRAHEWKTLLDAQKHLEDRQLPINLIFQGGGPERAAAKAYAAQLQLKRCSWLDYASDENLVASHLAAHTMIVTQRPETRGMLWPSKIALLRHLSRPIVFIGDTTSAVARVVSEHSEHSAVFPIGAAEALANHLEETRQTLPAASSASPIESLGQAVDAQRTQAQSDWCRWIEMF